MPWRLPLGVSVAVLKSAWASSHSTRSFFPASRQWLRDGGNRADGERVVAAEKDRHAVRHQFGVDRVVNEPVPRHDFRQVAEAVDRREHRIERVRSGCPVAHVGAEPRDRLRQSGHAQRLGAHAGAAGAGADVGGRADEADRLPAHAAQLTAADADGAARAGQGRGICRRRARFSSMRCTYGFGPSG